jgi:GNAT superfamily N-acetyltransferase
LATDYPLTKANRIRLAQAFRDVPRVDIAIDACLEGQMGQAMADDGAHPQAFAIRVGPFCYLAGASDDDAGATLLRGLALPMMVMASGAGWIEAVKSTFGTRVKTYERYSFSSHALSRDHLETLQAGSPWRDHVERIDLALATDAWSHPGVVDIASYDSPDDFVERGIGFCLVDAGECVAAAYSSIVCTTGIEVSLFVEQARRRQGIATALSAALLGECLNRGLHPNWDAANDPSYGLALKLGYVPTGSYVEHYVAA